MSEDGWLEGWYLELHGLSQWLPWAQLPSDTGNHQNHTEQPGKMAVALAPLWESSYLLTLGCPEPPLPPTLNSQTPGRAKGHILSFRVGKVLQREYLWKKTGYFRDKRFSLGLFKSPPPMLLCGLEIHTLVLRHQSHTHIHAAFHLILNPLLIPITH